MSYKILLIDDSLTQLETLNFQLINAGFEVETARDGAEGYQKVFTSFPDAILSDIVMPNLNGYQLCRLLKNNPITREIPIILLTVLDKKIDKFWGNKSGADMFLSKNLPTPHIDLILKDLISNNPVSEDYKSSLINHAISEETIQNEINTIFDDLLMDSTLVNEFRDLGEYLSNEKLLAEKIFSLLNSFVDYNVAGLFFNNLDSNEKNTIYMDINKNPVSGFLLEKIKRDFFTEMPQMKPFSIADYGHVIINEQLETDERIVSPDDLKSVNILPILSEGKLLGGICFYNKDIVDYPKFKFYKTIVNELFLLSRMRYLYSETEYLSVTDGLTGLYNRRHFEVNIEREFLRTKRYPADLSLAMIDIDYFKKVNDTYGHQFGDYVLKEISGILLASFRKTDMIYRYGGEELTVILTETSIENAMIPLGRLKDEIANHKFSYNGEDARITVSIGLSTNFKHIKTQKELIETADKSLYKAKQDGRNRLVAYSNEQFEQNIQL